MRSVHRLGIGIVACAALCALPGAAEAGGSIKVLRSVGFAEGTFVRPAIKSECNLEDRVPQWVQQYAQKNGIEVELVDALPGTGRVLELEITDAIEMGNAWTGRQKGLVIQGRLLEDGRQGVLQGVADDAQVFHSDPKFNARRSSCRAYGHQPFRFTSEG